MSWEPANAVEAALYEALRHGDQQRYLAVLAQALLLVPMQAPGGDGTAAPAWPVPVEMDDGARAVPAYTSPEALAGSSVTGLTAPHLPVPLAALAARWPDPAWLLAVDPGLPVAGHLAGAELPALAASVFAPVNEAERRLAAASTPADVLAVLAGAELHLPAPPPEDPTADPPDVTDPTWWLKEDSGADGVPVVVPVFTSPQRLYGCLGLTHPRLGAVRTALPVLALAWPDPGWALAVNPGAPWGVTLLGEQLARLAQRFSDEITAGLELQVLVPPELVPAYLDEGYGTVAGVVHVCPDEPVPLPDRYRSLGLLRPGAPGWGVAGGTTAGDESAYAVRWRPEPEVRLRWAADPTPRTETAPLPAGAQLVELHTGGTERLVATYDPDHHGWTPASG